MGTFDLTMEDYTIILNALHYYKKVEKHPNFDSMVKIESILEQNGIPIDS